mmetsp:Transcript_11247/g.38372  ORF Transcript_11247/g.38372 Transcript_11247/m.38372 type:complete len:134 (-) Transcript_11247:1742-2143(-)
MVLCNKTARSAGMIAHRHQTQACGVRCEEQRLSATGQVRFIHHDGHPCKGQRGLFAIRVWEPFEVLGEYCGVVKVPNDQEARQCDSDYAVAVYKEMKPDSSTTSEEWQAARTASFRSLTWEGGLRSLWLSQGK